MRCRSHALLAERHQIRVTLAIKPLAPLDKLGMKIGQVGNRATKRGQAKFQENPEYLEGSTGVRLLRCARP